jgi:DNA-directed RNA polymerase specialized sigma24 family protein
MYKIVQITKEEELECFNKYSKSDDLQDLEKVFLSLYGVYRKKILTYAKILQIEAEDLQQQFFLHVIKALPGFKLDKGLRFSTYCGYILRTVFCSLKKAADAPSRVISKHLDHNLNDEENTSNFENLIEDITLEAPDSLLEYEQALHKIDSVLLTNKRNMDVFMNYIIMDGNTPQMKTLSRTSIRDKVYHLRNKLKEALR